ncbi:MAG: hypothetical protein Q8O76_02640 [Chloroflexota bacterium]|nr:hypothetical protein [Chloroflexota bacterium]
MIYWAPLLHFYQPSHQIPYVLRQVARESYRPLLELFRQYPHARVTVNICGVLTELLYDHGLSDVYQGLAELAQRGQVEFTGSAKFHPILPLLPRAEVERQIKLNYQINRHFLGEVYAPRGFFPPELAYSPEIIPPVVASGHRWLLLAGLACPSPWPTDVIYQVGQKEGDGGALSPSMDSGQRLSKGLAVFFRDDILSNKVSFRSIDASGFVKSLGSLGGKGKAAYVVTAQDGETFGHHIKHWERLFLGRVIRALEPNAQRRASSASGEPIQMVTISQLLDLLPRGQRVEAKSSSWSTSEPELAAGNPYPLWKHPQNSVHRYQWEHLGLTLDLVKRAERLASNAESRRYARAARSFLDRAWHSCQFWWANRPPLWDMNMVDRGLTQQQEAVFNAYRSVAASNAREDMKLDSYHKLLACRALAGKVQDQLLSSAP